MEVKTLMNIEHIDIIGKVVFTCRVWLYLVPTDTQYAYLLDGKRQVVSIDGDNSKTHIDGFNREQREILGDVIKGISSPDAHRTAMQLFDEMMEEAELLLA